MATIAFGAGQLAPSAPTNLRFVSANSSSPSSPPSASSIDVRSGHPRMHFTPESLPAWRARLAGPLRTQWQQFVNRTSRLLPNPEHVNADLYALVYVAGTVPGIDYGGNSPEAFAAEAVRLMREYAAIGVENLGRTMNYASVNHPFHAGGHKMESFARAHDWLWDYPGYTAAAKQEVAQFLLDFSLFLFEVNSPNNNQPRMQWDGPGDALSGAPGSEAHHPWYYVLPLVGDGLVSETRVRQILATFETHWLNGAWLDLAHYESRGAGTRALGTYGNWYPIRLIYNFHAWKTATGQDYFNSPTPLSPDAGYFRNYPLTYGMLQKPQKPAQLLPIGQASGDVSLASRTMQLLTGVLEGQPARWAAHLGGGELDVKLAVHGLYLLLYDPTVTPEPIPPGVVHYETYGLIVDRRADGTILTMGAPPVRLRGHTWATKGGGPREGLPLGVTLQVGGVPVLVKHVGAHRGKNKSFGQNAVRFHDPQIPTTDTTWFSGGFRGNPTRARRVQDIKPSDDLGGIKEWTRGNPNRAVADLTKWYEAGRVARYIRTYEWGPNFLRVIDDIETTRPDILVWSRWYTGHVPTVRGAGVPVGVSERAAPDAIALGPVTWTLVRKPNATLHVVGGPGFEWVDDVGNLYADKSDMGVLASEGGLEIGTYTITLKSVGSGRWEHSFTW